MTLGDLIDYTAFAIPPLVVLRVTNGWMRLQHLTSEGYI